MLKLRVSIIQAKRSVIVILITILLSDCGVNTSVPVSTLGITPTFPSSLPTATMPLPAPPLTSTPTPSLPISSAPDELRIAYVIDGNLYFQVGSKPAVQLTNSGEDWHISFFSEDGEKIFFLRGITSYNLYSINVDGSQEKVLVTNDILRTLGEEYDEESMICHINLVPNTHILLFQTCFYPELNNHNLLDGNNELLAVDGDTGDIKIILPPGRVRDYHISPDGQLLAIHAKGHVDLFDINGEVIRRNLITYTSSEPIYIPPDVHWMQDSNGLIVVLPLQTFFDTSGGAPNYTIWRYALDGSPGAQVHLDPMPRDLVKVSPDGNWVIFHDERGALYIGDLRNGSSQSYEPRPGFSLYEWSPDSRYFIYGGVDLYRVSTNASPVFIDKGDFIGWLDANRFLYISGKTIVMGSVDGEKKAILSDVYEVFRENIFFTFVLVN